MMNNGTSYNFISNNFKGIQGPKKGLKLFGYLKQNINFNGLILFQETHSSINEEKLRIYEFYGPLFFLRRIKFFRYTGFRRKNDFHLINQNSDENGQILIIEAKTHQDSFILINIYNFNTESEELKMFSVFQNMLKFEI